jgi:methyl-accepting chemotaxis protein
LSLEREVDQMLNDMTKKEGWTRSYALSVLRSKFESEERYQEVAYVDDLIKNEGEEVEKGPKFEPTTTTTNTVAEEITETKERVGTISSSVSTPSKATTPQQKVKETISPKSISKQLDKQTTQINKKIAQMLQPLQKHLKSVDKQSQLIRQLQSQLKQLQRQVSQIQKAVGMGKGKKKDSK